MRRFILIPHLKIHNANALSSPYTIGFPAMTAWLGAVHALQRTLQAQGYDNLELKRTAISCHHFDLQTYKGQNDFIHSIVGTANPLDKDGNRPAFIEEARCHLTVSLLVEVIGQKFNRDEEAKFLPLLEQNILKMKFASGDVIKLGKPCELVYFDDEEDHHTELKPIINKLMLGNVLIERRDLMQQAMQNDQANALDTLLDYLKVTHQPIQTEHDDKAAIHWQTKRKISGWLVPIAVGFQGLSELGIAKHQRDQHTPHRFAESVMTLGEFIMPYRIQHLDQLFWEYHVDLNKDLYLCKNTAYSNYSI